MANFFVSTTGNDGTGTGDITHPWRHIAFGMAQLHSGDTLNVRSGTYSETIFLPTIASGGSWGTATIVQAYPPDLPFNPVIQGYIAFNGVSFIIVDGINFTGIASDATPLFYVDGCHSIWLRNCDVGFGWNQNIASETQPGFQNDDLRFTNIVSHDSGQGGPNPSAPSHGIYISNQGSTVAGPVLIDSCIFYNHTADPNSYGIQIFAGTGNPRIDNCTISNNEVRNCGNGITFGDSNNSSIFNNSFHDCSNAAQGTGIAIQSGTPTNTLIYNNLVYNNGWDGIQLGAFGVPSGTLIYNNTTYNNGTVFGGYGIRVIAGSGTVGQNNILYLDASGATNGTGTFNHNLSTNPSFVSIGTDFHLQSTSAALASNGFTGVNLFATFTKDKDGNLRQSVGNWDGGAYIFVSLDILLGQMVM